MEEEAVFAAIIDKWSRHGALISAALLSSQQLGSFTELLQVARACSGKNFCHQMADTQPFTQVRQLVLAPNSTC